MPEKKMVDPELLERLKAASVDERISLIEAILQSLKRDIHSTTRQSIAETRPLRGKVCHYEDPYEPVAAEEWEASA